MSQFLVISESQFWLNSYWMFRIVVSRQKRLAGLSFDFLLAMPIFATTSKGVIQGLRASIFSFLMSAYEQLHSPPSVTSWQLYPDQTVYTLFSLAQFQFQETQSA